MPLGIRCSAVFTPLITKVWPALCPPLKRTTPCALCVSQSTSLPLPSSPHWVPTTTTLRPLVAVIQSPIQMTITHSIPKNHPSPPSASLAVHSYCLRPPSLSRTICKWNQTACTTQRPDTCASSRSQWNSSTSLSCPGKTQTTVSPAARRSAIAAFTSAASPQGARMAASNVCGGPTPTTCLNSRLSPPAGRLRPNTAPTSS